MNIVVLDGYTLNPGDLSWDELESIGSCQIHDRISPTEVVARASNAEIILTNKTVLTREHIAQLPKLKYIGVLATGTNVVDLTAARDRGIPVTNVPAYGTDAVAQHTFALLLELASRVGRQSDSVRRGDWARSKDFCYWSEPIEGLAGLTFGIIGLGNIGHAVARIALGFRMNVIVHVRRPQTGVGTEIRFVDLDTLFREADVVSLHCPLTDETRNMINAQRLASMKPTALLINTARGPLVDERALTEALNAGRIAGAGLDVLSIEPPPADHALISAKNCIVTPHVAWGARSARARLMREAVENIRAFLNQSPRNVVN